MTCACFIIPQDALERFAKDIRLTGAQRKMFADTAAYERHWRQLRTLAGTDHARARALPGEPPPVQPSLTVYDCANGTVLPGAPVPRPQSAKDETTRHAYRMSRAVLRFLKTAFGRHSLDGLGVPLVSSVHFGSRYGNAFWNGRQMTYGDGDGDMLVDFTASADVVCHELMHGVTQYSAQFAYADEAGGLNESMSDVFAAMFRQWLTRQTVDRADWLIGADILGPGARARGLTCLRDLAKPDGTHCLTPQPTHYSQYKPGMSPHRSSGIPNLAFHRAAMAIGGSSWRQTGSIWYRALTDAAPAPQLGMKAFADRTRDSAKSMSPGDSRLFDAVHEAWRSVGL